MTPTWAAVWFVLLVSPSVVFAIWSCVRKRRWELFCAVFNNLDDALETGQFDPLDGYLHGMGAEEIAYDLTCYASNVDVCSAEQLTPYVRMWLDSRKHRLALESAT